MLEKALLQWAKSQGYRVAWGTCEVLDEVKSHFHSLHETGTLDQIFESKMLSWVFSPDGFPVPDRKTVVLIAIPRPVHTVAFELASGRFDAILPPTYVNYRKTMSEIRDRLRKDVFGPDCELEILPAPLKTIAAGLGMVVYGRNNISYIEGLGSYYQLVGLLTDIELELSAKPPAQEPAQAAECETCDLCIKACPTRAITDNRFLIQAEHCLTYHNESKDPFPEDLNPSVHHCLIGCMRCQRVCPLNRGVHRVVSSDVSFDREETEAFIQCENDRSGPVWRAIKEKLEILGLTEDEVVLSRNLRAMIDGRAAR
jgi:epoxyqueuosine reductase